MFYVWIPITVQKLLSPQLEDPSPKVTCLRSYFQISILLHELNSSEEKTPELVVDNYRKLMTVVLFVRHSLAYGATYILYTYFVVFVQ